MVLYLIKGMQKMRSVTLKKTEEEDRYMLCFELIFHNSILRK